MSHRQKINFKKQTLSLLDNLEEEEIRRDIQNDKVWPRVTLLTSNWPWPFKVQQETYAEQKCPTSLSFDGWEYDSDINDEDNEWYDEDDDCNIEDEEWYEYLFCLEFPEAD